MTEGQSRIPEWCRIPAGMIPASLLLVAFCCSPVVAQEPQGSSTWNYDAVLYGWLAGLSGEIGLGESGQEVEASFEDLLNLVDFAGAGHFEARSSGVVLLADLSYVGLGAEREAEVANQPVDVDLDLNQWIIEAGGGWRTSRHFELLLVGRYYFLDFGSTSESSGGGSTSDASQDWGDLFVGARYSRAIAKQWMFSIRGDIGAGGSDFAWFADIALGYQFTELFSALASWRVLSLDRSADSADDLFKYDVTQSGLGIGARFSF